MDHVAAAEPNHPRTSGSDSPVSGMRLVSTYVAAIAISTAGMLPVMLLGTLAVQIRHDLRFSNTGLATAVALYFLGSAAMSVAAGRLCERIALRSSLLIAAASGFASVIGAVMAPRFWLLCAALLVGVFAAALSTPASNILVTANIRSSRQGFAHGAKQAAIPFAGVLAGLAVPILGVTVGWRAAFATAAVVPLVGAVSSAHATSEMSSSISDRMHRFDRQRGDRGNRTALRLITVSVFLMAAAVTSLTSFIVVASTEAGISEATAGWLVAIASALVIVTRVVVGHLADTVLRDRLGVVVVMFGLSVVGYLMLALERPALIAIGIMLALGTGWGWPGLVTLTVVERHPADPGWATGHLMTGIYSGAVMGPLAFAAVESWSGFPASWTMAGGFAAAATGIMFVTRRVYSSP